MLRLQPLGHLSSGDGTISRRETSDNPKANTELRFFQQHWADVAPATPFAVPSFAKRIEFRTYAIDPIRLLDHDSQLKIAAPPIRAWPVRNRVASGDKGMTSSFACRTDENAAFDGTDSEAAHAAGITYPRLLCGRRWLKSNRHAKPSALACPNVSNTSAFRSSSPRRRGTCGQPTRRA